MRRRGHEHRRGAVGPAMRAAVLIAAGVAPGLVRAGGAELGEGPGSRYPTVANEPGDDHAYPAGVTMDFELNELDVNANGMLDGREARRLDALAERFDSVDTNEDLQIAPREFAEFERERMRRQQEAR